MAGLKRKEVPNTHSSKAVAPQKKQKFATNAAPKNKKSKLPVGADLPESDTTEDEDDFDGIPSDDGAAAEESDGSDLSIENGSAAVSSKAKQNGDSGAANGDKKFKGMLIEQASKDRADSSKSGPPLPKHTLLREQWPKSAKPASPTQTQYSARRRSGNV